MRTLEAYQTALHRDESMFAEGRFPVDMNELMSDPLRQQGRNLMSRIVQLILGNGGAISIEAVFLPQGDPIFICELQWREFE